MFICLTRSVKVLTKFLWKPRILPQQTIVENEKIYDLTSNPVAHIYQLNISNFWTVYSIFNRSPPPLTYSRTCPMFIRSSAALSRTLYRNRDTILNHSSPLSFFHKENDQKIFYLSYIHLISVFIVQTDITNTVKSFVLSFEYITLLLELIRHWFQQCQ